MGSFYAMQFAACAEWHSFVWTSHHEERWCLYKSLVPALTSSGPRVVWRVHQALSCLFRSCRATQYAPPIVAQVCARAPFSTRRTLPVNKRQILVFVRLTILA